VVSRTPGRVAPRIAGGGRRFDIAARGAEEYPASKEIAAWGFISTADSFKAGPQDQAVPE